MYERFTDRARKVMQIANAEAQRFRHEHLGVEHVLLGLVKEGSGVAATALKNLGVDLHAARRVADKMYPPHEPIPDGVELWRTPHVDEVVELSRKEADALNHSYIGTEHLLLGLCRQTDTNAAEVLGTLKLTPEAVRAEVLRLIGHDESAKLAGQWVPETWNVYRLDVTATTNTLPSDVGLDPLYEVAGLGKATEKPSQSAGDSPSFTAEIARALSESAAKSRELYAHVEASVRDAAGRGDRGVVLYEGEKFLPGEHRELLQSHLRSAGFTVSVGCGRWEITW